MKLVKTNILDSTSSGTYDQTKTMLRGNVFAKTISSKTYLGPSLNKWIDVYTNTGLAPASVYCTTNGRLFATAVPVNGTTYDTLPIFLYDFDFTTGVNSYVGRIDLQLPNLAATTSTLKSIKVLDTGTTGWKIFITTTASVTINGGLFMANNIDKADFVAVGFPVIPMATSTNAKAVYFLQDPSNIGVGQLNIASCGSIIDSANNRIYVHNGVSATHQYYVYDTSAAPTYTTASVSVSVSSPGLVTHTGHSFQNNDPVIFTAGTLPTGLVVGTPYFVRNAIPAVSYELSTTSGGASINTTGSASSGAVIGRAWGTVGSNFVHKTGNLPAIVGTLIGSTSTVDAEDYALPQHSVNAGFGCAFFGSTTNMYLGKLSELTSGATSWPSLITVNNNADSSTVAQTARAYAWSNSLDKALINTTGSIRLILKQMVSSSSDRIFGRTNISYYEGTSPTAVYFGTNTEINMIGIDMESGWLFVASNAIGQRGIIAADIRSDSLFDYSYIITPVQSITSLSILKAISRVRALDNQTDGILVSYRTSGFGSETGGWTALTSFDEYTIAITTGQIQFKIQFDTFAKEGKGLHAQINEILMGIEDANEISDYWEFSDDWSNNTTPSRIAFRLKKAYTTSVPQLFFRAFDLSNSQLVNHNTVTNISNFEYSTNNGTSWLPLGTIPNTVGTLVRYTFTSPPGVDIRPGLKES